MTPVAGMMAIALAVALIGVTVLLHGWRGHRVGDHPCCRRCGFDLFGRPDGSTTCPECGRDLNARRAIVTGVRKRFSGMIAAGVALVLLGLAAPAYFAWDNYDKINWQQYKPVFWLMHDASGSNPVAQVAAFNELRRRLSANALSKSQVATVVDAALKAQGNVNQPWIATWGDLVEAARSAKLVSDAQWRKYAEQAVPLNWLGMSLPAEIRRGVAVHGYLMTKGARVANESNLQAFIRCAGIVIDAKETPIEEADSNVGGVPLIASVFPANAVFAVPSEMLWKPPLGPHAGYMRVKIRVTDRDPLDAPMPAKLDAVQAQIKRFTSLAAIEAEMTGSNLPVHAIVDVKVPFQFELVGPVQLSAGWETDPNLQKDIRSATTAPTTSSSGIDVRR